MGPTKKRTVCLLGVTKNTDNYGVRVLLTSAVEALSIAEADADIVVLDYGHSPQAWTERTSTGEQPVRLLNLRYSWRLHLPNNIFRIIGLAVLSRLMPSSSWKRWFIQRNQWLSEITAAETHYAISGGDSFSDIYGVGRFVYVALPQILVLLLGRSLVLLPQTYGPFKGFISRSIARWILLRAKKIYSRDSNGVEIVGALARDCVIKVYSIPDLGFGMQSVPISEKIKEGLQAIRKRRPIVGLNVSRLLYSGGYSKDNMFGLLESFPVLIQRLAEHLTMKLGAHVLLVPHVCGGPSSEEDETALCKKLQISLDAVTGGRLLYLDLPFDHQQMKALIGECDVFVGARMHACIAAVSQGVPTVCLAYSQKFAGVMEPLGEGARVVDLRHSTAEDVVTVIDDVFHSREQLRNQLAVAATAVQESARHLKNDRAAPRTQGDSTELAHG